MLVRAHAVTTHQSLAAHLAPTLRESSVRLPIVTGGCGSGRTSLLLCLHRLCGGAGVCQYVDLERLVTTPERFVHALISQSPFVAEGVMRAALPRTPRAAFDTAVRFLATARTSTGEPATFLVDELLELRTFENFPGLRSALCDLLRAVTPGLNRFVFTTRFVTRTRRLLRHLEQVQLVPMPALSAEMVGEELRADGEPPHHAAELAHDLQVLGNGCPAYVAALQQTMQRMPGTDPITALVALFEPGGELHARLRFSYELRLHRARGYGVLKAILDLLAEQEPLTLTEIAHRLHRTPGSTKDYLSWLEDVDLIAAVRKRYAFTDPLLRAWVRVNNRATVASSQDITREVQQYALTRLASHARSAPDPTPPVAPASTVQQKSPSARLDVQRDSIIEFD